MHPDADVLATYSDDERTRFFRREQFRRHDGIEFPESRLRDAGRARQEDEDA